MTMRPRECARVLLLVENNPYPKDFRVRREAEALRANHFDVTVIAPRERGQAWAETVEGIRVLRFPAPPAGRNIAGYACEFAWATLAILGLALWVSLRRGVDVVHAANPPDTLFAVGGVLRLFGAKFIFDHHDLSPEIYRSRSDKAPNPVVLRCLATMERWSFALADVVISTNESYKAIAVARGRKDPRKVFVVRNGPPATYVAVSPDTDLRARAPYLVGYVGTIGPQDGLDCWVLAVRELVQTLGRKNVLAVIVGDGDALEKVRALVADLQLETYFLFTGRLDESRTRAILSTVDVCVQPDPMSPLNDRSTMNKLTEYMALGKPSVAFDLHETRVTGGDAAVYVESGDVLAFAKRVDDLLRDPEECARLGAIGRRRIQAQLSWEHSIPALLDAYREVLGPAHATSRARLPGARPRLDPE